MQAEDLMTKKDSVQGDGAEFVRLDNGYHVWIKRSGHGPITILLLHGGPGLTHEIFECFEDFFPKDKFQIIYYDQLGSYHSDQPNDPSLWTVDRFCEEVEQVRKALGLENFYLFGHSWGAMLAIEYSLKYQSHLKAVIISNMAASIDSYVTYINKLRSELPHSIQDQLAYYEKKGDFLNPAYEKIIFEEVYTRHLCRLKPVLEHLFRTPISLPVYHAMQGPNEFVVTGNFRNWNRWNDLSKITIPTLLFGGRYDTMDPQDIEKMGTLIPHATVKICENGSHLSMYDDQENYFQALFAFLERCEKAPSIKKKEAKRTLLQSVIEGRAECARANSIFSPLPGAVFETDAQGTIYYSAGMNYATFNGIIDPDENSVHSDEEINKAIEFFASRKLPFMWWTGAKNLEQKGFGFGGVLTGVAVDISQGFSQEKPSSPQLEIKIATSDAELQLFSALFKDLFNLPIPTESLFAWTQAITNQDEQVCFLAYLNGTPVGIASLSTGPSTAGIWNLATVPEYRKRGVASALVSRAMLEAETRHYKHVMAILMPKGMASGLFTKLGFREVCTFPFYIYGASPDELE